MKSQIGMPFDINGEEYILEEIANVEKIGAGNECNRCHKELKGNAYRFIQYDNSGKYVQETIFGSECAKKIIGAGFGKGDLK